MLTITHTWLMQSDAAPEKAWKYQATVVINDETDQAVVTKGKIDIVSAVKPCCDNCEMNNNCLSEVNQQGDIGWFAVDITSCSAFKPKEQK